METLVVGIAGGSGSGKSTLCRALLARLGDDGRLIHHDSYYKDQSKLAEAANDLNYDHPSALDTALLVEHVKALKAGDGIQTPVYDFKTHSRSKATVTVSPANIIIVEGILLFAEPTLVKQLDMRIFVQASADIRLDRRIKRDTRDRGRTRQSVLDQWKQSVQPMFQQFVAPSIGHANLIIPCETPNPEMIRLLSDGLLQRLKKD